MHLTNRVREFLIDQNYYIDIYENHIHVFHYIDVIKLEEEEIILQMEQFQLHMKGYEFRVKQLEKQEILISGVIESLVFQS